MKPSKLQDHLRRCHPDKTEKDLKYFQTLKDKFQKRPTLDRMFASTSQRNDDGLRASCNISLLIAKSGKPHTIGEKLILPAVEEVLKTVLHKPASDIIKTIPLSNNIDEMSSDIESFFCNYLQTTHFSIQLDESTLPDNAALLLAYVRFIMNQEIYEELLFARTSITDTKDFESRFEDILTMVIPPWIINPYGDIEDTNVIIQEELTELSTNEELKVQFKNGYQQFWLQNNIPVTYPVLWNIARTFLIPFPSSYLVERGFSAVTNLLTKKRNRLDIISRGDLRLTLTKLTPNVDNLLLKHQVHPSH
ncbi:unnamed protein product [Acanthoscelides obtectus]|uniref:SCAN domain-containing protein 3 n=1 Tax=Acanthoscelides obtectus TaxID=200917 RepID=A0A9P0QFW5_ACAOB|nr:unnamed protein product [Acanthoscelides obtectus]CAK1684409.1 SCAN domain-containing protein 3 [Acanthoscelides obtectus]